MGIGSGGRLGATAAVLPGSGLSKIHIGQYGCRNICIIIEEYLIKQGEIVAQLLCIIENNSRYINQRIAPACFTPSTTHIF